MLRAGQSCSVLGAAGSSTAVLVGGLSRLLSSTLLLVTAHLDEADEAAEELLAMGVDVRRLPAMEVAPGESGINLEQFAERLSVCRDLAQGRQHAVLTTSIQSLMQSVPTIADTSGMLRRLEVSGTCDPRELVGWLAERGYTRTDAVDSPGEYALRGGILDVHPIAGGVPVRLDFFGNEIESIHEIDLDTMGSDRRIDHADIFGVSLAALNLDHGVSLLEILPTRPVTILPEFMEIQEQARSYYERVLDARGIRSPSQTLRELNDLSYSVVDVNHLFSGLVPERTIALPVSTLPELSRETSEAFAEIAGFAEHTDIHLFVEGEGERDRLRELYTQHIPLEIRSRDVVRIIQQYLHRGFIWEPDAETVRPLAILPYHELLHRYHVRRTAPKLRRSRAIEAFLDMQPGDLVVHREHGVAKFISFGLLPGDTASSAAPDEEFLTLEFSGGAKLHVPATKIDLVQRYVGSMKGRPQLSKLGGKRWKKQKQDAEDAVRDLASDMLKIQAARNSQPGIRFPSDTEWMREFEAEFPYQETEDQLSAIAAIKRDMQLSKPMDRLVCGDVGFGKTEVAVRAAFKAVEFGKQAAVLVPTTLLAEQHERTFRQRFADYPFRIESLSRFKTRKAQRLLLEELQAGRIDVIVGTHRLLSSDVRFRDLGLVVIDEEQRFGVEHKQRLLELRTTADVLTLSATPSPRTLHMSMLGLRDISSLTTPPADRRSIVTEVIQFDRRRIERAIQRELAREGQVFFVHNRVYNIHQVADDVRSIVPDARIIVGHGQMSSRELEKVMLSFIRREADVLVSTTIIESGIDIPTANTMIINDADMFGLSELHQLRGRVGRFKHRAYCYLLLPADRTMTESAVKRLRAIEDFSMLGAGFKIAMRDLEIRGAGNLLGAEQSGHIEAVGYDLYCELLHQAVRAIGQDDGEEDRVCEVSLGISGTLTKGYIPSDQRRMEAYRRIAQARTVDQLCETERDLRTAYGDPPGPSRRLLELAEIRVLGASIGVASITRHHDDIIFLTSDLQTLEHRFSGVMGTIRPVGQPDGSGLVSVYYRPPKPYLEPGSLLAILRRRLAGSGS